MVTLEQVRATLDAMNPATVGDVRITTEEDGLSHRDSMAPPGGAASTRTGRGLP